jgi:hypothetical protein
MLWVDFLPIFLFLVKNSLWRNNLQIFSFLTASFLTQIISLLLVYRGYENILLIKFYSVFSSLIIFYFFYSRLKLRKGYLLVNILLLCLIGFYSFRKSFEIHFILINSLILVNSLFSLIYSLKQNIIFSLIDNSFIYSLLFYYSASIVIVYILPIINEDSRQIWIVHNLIEMISKLIIAYSIWKLPSKSVS